MAPAMGSCPTLLREICFFPSRLVSPPPPQGSAWPLRVLLPHLVAPPKQRPRRRPLPARTRKVRPLRRRHIPLPPFFPVNAKPVCVFPRLPPWVSLWPTFSACFSSRARQPNNVFFPYDRPRRHNNRHQEPAAEFLPPPRCAAARSFPFTVNRDLLRSALSPSLRIVFFPAVLHPKTTPFRRAIFPGGSRRRPPTPLLW